MAESSYDHIISGWGLTPRNSQLPDLDDAEDFELGTDKLAYLLPHFVMEAHSQDKTPYPLCTLVQLVVGIQHYLRENGKPDLSIPGNCVVEYPEKKPVCAIAVDYIVYFSNYSR